MRRFKMKNVTGLHIRLARPSSIRSPYKDGKFLYDILHGRAVLWTSGPAPPEDVLDRVKCGKFAPIIDWVFLPFGIAHRETYRITVLQTGVRQMISENL